jgi:hypothetical protein
MTGLIINIAATLIYGIYLLLPGYILLACAGAQRNRFVLSYGLSVSIVILTLIPLSRFGVDIGLSLVTFHLFVAVLILGVLLNSSIRRRNKVDKNQRRRPTSQNLYGFGFIFVLTSFGLYHLIVGPYTEIPSDFWKHLARVGVESTGMADGSLGQSSASGNNQKWVSPVYVIHALVARLLGANPLELVAPATLVTSCLFLGSIYWFTLTLLGRFGLGNGGRTVGALLATALTFVTVGTASFSYVRYYAYFPTIFAFPLIYGSAVIMLHYLERPKNNGCQLLLIPIFLTTMWVIHRQEALLAIILLAVIALVRGVRSYLPSSGMSTTLKWRARFSAQFFLILLVLVTIYAWTSRTMDLWDRTPHVIDAGQFFSPLAGIPIDNPFFRFWDTLGYFGLGVYAWTIMRWKTLSRSDFLSAGMLMPLLTNLNPIYAVIFLHFGTATSLWRTAYLMPLGIVAAILFTVTFLPKSFRVTSWQRVVGWIVAPLLLISIMPWSFQGNFNRTSRAPSLLPVHETSGANLWQDLIRTVDQIQAERLMIHPVGSHFVRRIITDSVTRFVLYSATRGEIWWWPDGEYFPGHHDDYRKDLVESDFSHSLLIINRRNGSLTDSARYSGHWPPDILKIANLYPHDLEKFVEQHPTLFKMLWHTDDIKIFLIRPTGY